MHRDFAKRHRIQLPGREQTKEDLSAVKVHQATRASFSHEWHQFQYRTDKTFDWDIEERKSLFLEEMGLDRDSLQGKTLLDAGCGNGVLTSALADFGLETVGLDQSDSVARADRHNTSQRVSYVQGNVMTPPFKRGTFDLVYSSGVLHHTPDTRRAFGGLTPVLKGGGRMYVWLYGTGREGEPNLWKQRTSRGKLSQFFRDHITSRLPSRIQHGFFVALALSRKAVYPVLTLARIRKLKVRKWSEEMAAIYDFYAPPYQHLHHAREVREWFAGEGFKNITLSESWYAGFGIHGDLKQQ